MCSEARGLSGWPRTAARWAVLIAATLVALVALAFGPGLPTSAITVTIADWMSARMV